MTTAPSVTVVVPSYNRAASLARLLEALREVDRPGAAEVAVVVVDDGSTDETAAVVASVAPSAVYLRQPNAGPAAARNLGWQAASTEIVAFTDDDCVPSKGWLTELLQPFEDPTVEGVGGTVEAMVQSGLADFVQAERFVSHGRGTNGDALYLVTANAAFRRSVLARVGGFDESFPRAAGEDTDLGYKVRAAGGRLVITPGAVVAHDHRMRPRQLMRTYYRHGRARAQLARHHPDLAVASGARRAFRPAGWREHMARYRTGGASVPRAMILLCLRMLGLVSFGLGVARERWR